MPNLIKNVDSLQFRGYEDSNLLSNYAGSYSPGFFCRMGCEGSRFHRRYYIIIMYLP